MKQIVGQIGLFDAKPVNQKNECLGEPCMHCDVEWCSAKCFIRRGYMWDRIHRFVKGSDGKQIVWPSLTHGTADMAWILSSCV